MTLSTYAEQVSHYSAVHARLMGERPEPRVERAIIPPPHKFRDYTFPAGPYRPGEFDQVRMMFPSCKTIIYSQGRFWPRNMPKWQVIMREVCAKHGVETTAVMSPSREKHLVAARSEIYWICRTKLGMSLPELGRRFKRDHTTIYWGVKSFAKKVSEVGSRPFPPESEAA